MIEQAAEVEQVTIGELLALGIKLEIDARRLYEGFAQMFEDCPAVAKFWCRLAADEASHESRLRGVLAGMSRRRLSQAGDLKMLRGARALLVASVEDRLREIHNLDDAYEMANDLECSETNTIFRFFLTELSQDMHVVATLMQDLDEHVECLITGFPAEYSTRTDRMAVQAKRP